MKANYDRLLDKSNILFVILLEEAKNMEENSEVQRVTKNFANIVKQYYLFLDKVDNES